MGSETVHNTIKVVAVLIIGGIFATVATLWYQNNFGTEEVLVTEGSSANGPFPALSDSTPTNAVDLSQLRFVPNADQTIALEFFVDDTYQVQAEVDYLKTLAAERSGLRTDRLQFALLDYYQTPFTQDTVLGDVISAQDYPKTRALFDALIADVDVYVSYIQQKHKRQRPADAFADFSATISPDNPYSFPSEFAARIYVIEEVLSRLNDNHDQWHTWADDANYELLVAGVNYPEDIVAAYELASAYLLHAEATSPTFTQLLAEARAEWNTTENSGQDEADDGTDDQPLEQN